MDARSLARADAGAFRGCPLVNPARFFIFMGYVVEQAGLMERLFQAFRIMLAPVRGSLYLGVILTATVFAMATGIVGGP